MVAISGATTAKIRVKEARMQDQTDQVERAKRTIATWVRQWFRDATSDPAEEVKLGDIADEAVDHFLADQKFLHGPIADLIRMAAYDAAQRIVANTRNLVALGDTVVSREQAARRAKASAFWTWMEHVGNRHIRLPEMTREDLLTAAQERRLRGQREMGLADLWESIADKLEGGQRVHERFSQEELDSLVASRMRIEEAKEALRVASA
jgi:hypothetical protein